MNYSQQRSVSIVNRQDGLNVSVVFNEEPYSKSILGDKNVIEYFNAIDESLPGTPALPSKTYLIAIPPKAKISLRLVNQKYYTINNSEVRLNPSVSLSSDSSIVYKESKPNLSKFTSDSYPSKEIEVISYTWIRDYYCAVIRINTHKFNWKKKEIRELQSCLIKIDFDDVQTFEVNRSPLGEFDKSLKNVILNFNSVSQFRTFQPFSVADDSTGNWIDYSQEYVKLKIPEDGIYRIDYNQVVSFGISPQTINPKRLKIYFKGKEIPTFVFGENDLSFDPGDYIEFWCKKNYEQPNYRNVVQTGEDYLNYLDRYSDTSVVWLAWDRIGRGP